MAASCRPLTRGTWLQPRHVSCPDQESNRRLLASWDDTQPSEPRWPGLGDHPKKLLGELTRTIVTSRSLSPQTPGRHLPCLSRMHPNLPCTSVPQGQELCPQPFPGSLPHRIYRTPSYRPPSDPKAWETFLGPDRRAGSFRAVSKR